MILREHNFAYRRLPTRHKAKETKYTKNSRRYTKKYINSTFKETYIINYLQVWPYQPARIVQYLRYEDPYVMYDVPVVPSQSHKFRAYRNSTNTYVLQDGTKMAPRKVLHFVSLVFRYDGGS